MGGERERSQSRDARLASPAVADMKLAVADLNGSREVTPRPAISHFYSASNDQTPRQRLLSATPDPHVARPAGAPAETLPLKLPTVLVTSQVQDRESAGPTPRSTPRITNTPRVAFPRLVLPADVADAPAAKEDPRPLSGRTSSSGGGRDELGGVSVGRRRRSRSIGPNSGTL